MADTNDGERMSVVELVDENGQNAQFEHLMTLEHKGSDYIVLYPPGRMRRRRRRSDDHARGIGRGSGHLLPRGGYRETLEEVFSIFMETFEDEDDDDDGFDENDEDGGPLYFLKRREARQRAPVESALDNSPSMRYPV